MEKTLTIYFTTDTHGYVLPTDFATLEEKPMGLARVASEITKDENTLVIDGGDTLQGSPMTYFAQKQKNPAPMAQVMNIIGYDYITLGNHDFNYGQNTLSDFLNELDATCLCANIKDDTGKLKFIPSTIHTLGNGLRIGLIGITTEFIPVWERPENLKGIHVLNAVESIRREADTLRPNVDLLVGLYHGGIEKDLTTGHAYATTRENMACGILEGVKLDILLTGHQHIALANATYCGAHVVQTPSNAKQYIKLTAIVRDGEKTKITSELITPTAPPSGEIMTLLEPLNEQLQCWLDAPAGHLPHALLPDEKAKMAQNGCDIANFINQVQLEASGAQISCMSLANDIKGFSASPSVRDVVSTYVYPNTLITLSVTGAALKSALERAASYMERDELGEIQVSERFLKPKVEHYNYDFFLGIAYTFDLSMPVSKRVTRMNYQGHPIEPDQTFTLCMNNYRATGAGGYDAYKDCPRVKEGATEISELIIRYLEAHSNIQIERPDFVVR